jgi:hypothetical protein
LATAHPECWVIGIGGDVSELRGAAAKVFDDTMFDVSDVEKVSWVTGT